jgi:uncharacterized protein (TIGR02246 family)
VLALLAAVALAAGSSADEAVRAADVALDRASGARDAGAFGKLLEEDAVFAGGREVSRGRAAVVEAWTPFFRPGGASLRWAPVRVVVSASGDVAMTTGRWTLERAGPDGRPARAEGEYVTAWRRAADGAWRVAVDGSLEPAEKLGQGLVRSPVRTVQSAAGDLEATLGTWTRGGERGAFVTVRRRSGPGAWETLVESAWAFPPPAPKSG